MKSYDHKSIEKKWQERWEKMQVYKTKNDTAHEKYYLLMEFPYPSGNLHIGHWHAYAVPDIFARYLRMQGKDVLLPIGFDSFGLPAENAAIKHGVNPRTWTYENIERMTAQLRSMGNSFDWSRKVVASDPEYYKWTQWLFLQFFKRKLAYKKRSVVPWCDSCKTVLANEQIINGACERCDTSVVQKEQEQWFFKITDYAEDLIEGLDTLPWPEEIKQAQREWIGKSKGAEIPFTINDIDDPVTVFTTRPDTLFGVTYLVLAPEHPAVTTLLQQVENREEVKRYIQDTAKKKELERKEGKEKTGVPLKGVHAIHPITKKALPVWIADYVLASYGTGAVMAVPAHDVRDFTFAKKFHLPIITVIEGDELPYTAHGVLTASDSFNGMHSRDAQEEITKQAGGAMVTRYRLRDWLISRQRYWGCPIPIVYDTDGISHPVPEEHLPWTLPEDVDFTPTGEAPLAKSKELKERTERIFGDGWTPEVDTMDTFVDSSWYFLRYCDPHNASTFASKKAQQHWMPVDRYSGGAEHTTMHLLYSRFFHRALFDMGLVTTKEPYVERFNRGLILGPDGKKMSKSKGNTINPDDHVQQVGADTVKTYLAFIGPYNEVGQYPWDFGGIAGVRRFLERVYGLFDAVTDTAKEDNARTLLLHQTIKKVGEDIEAFKFNTAVSQLMVLVNAFERARHVSRTEYETLVLLIAPFAPHLAEELWEMLGNKPSIHTHTWPTYNETLLANAEVTVVVQVNGKTRGTFTIAPDANEHDLIRHAKALPALKKHLEGGEVVREVVIPNRLVNFVVK